MFPLDAVDEHSQAELALKRLRANAAKISAMLEAASDDKTNMHIWRALYVAYGVAVAACIMRQSGNPITAQITRKWTEDPGLPTQQITGNVMTGIEIATFLGLDDVEPDDVNWVEDKITSSNLAVVRGPDALRGIRHHD